MCFPKQPSFMGFGFRGGFTFMVPRRSFWFLGEPGEGLDLGGESLGGIGCWWGVVGLETGWAIFSIPTSACPGAEPVSRFPHGWICPWTHAFCPPLL